MAANQNGTTIDNLVIEIETNATQAYNGISALADALGQLRGKTLTKSSVGRISELAEAMKKLPNVSGAAYTIDRLATALTKMREVGSLVPAIHALEKFPAVITEIGNLSTNLNGVVPKVEQVVQAVAPLSQLKAGGLNSMVNGLRKIKKVTEDLDDKTIERFAERVEKLTTLLGPLSQQMTTIQAGLRGINSKARSASRSVAHLGTKVNTTTLNMASMTIAIRGMMSLYRPLIDFLQDAAGAGIEWDGIAARFGRGFGPQAEEAYEWIQRLQSEMKINSQVFMQYSSIFATMLTGFGVSMKDSTKMALGYTELTYDIWAGANDIYKTFNDAADAVKSAIAGEVEPIRRAGFTIIESTLEQTAANYGLEISLEHATEAQKSYLRYLTLVDQAHAQGLVGTYAREMQTGEGLLRTLAQQVKSLAQALGSLFLPVITKVVPWFQAFVELVHEAVLAVAQFFGVDIQPVEWGDASGGIGGIVDGMGEIEDGADGATGAVKKLRKTLLGIDELNLLNAPTEGGRGSGAGGAGGTDGIEGLDVDKLWDESIFAEIQQQTEELKEKLKPVLMMVGLIGAGFAAWKISQAVLDFINLISQNQGKFGIALAVTGIILEVDGIKSAIQEGLNNINFSEIFLGAGGIVIGGTMIGGVLGSAIIGGAIGGIVAGLPMFATGVYDALSNGLNELNTLLIIGGSTIVGTAIGALFGPAGAALGAFIGASVGALTSFGLWVYQNWDEIKQYFSDVWTEMSETWDEIAEDAKMFWPRIQEGITDAIDGLWDTLTEWWNKLKSWWDGLELPEIDIKWPHLHWSTREVGGWAALALQTVGLKPVVPALSVEWYANGGMPDVGQMFVAREAGPEMVGTINGHTAVANNDQIVEAIERGVYRAMSAAMAEGQKSGMVAKVNGKVLLETVAEEARSATVRYGRNPLFELV